MASAGAVVVAGECICSGMTPLGSTYRDEVQYIHYTLGNHGSVQADHVVTHSSLSSVLSLATLPRIPLHQQENHRDGRRLQPAVYQQPHGARHLQHHPVASSRHPSFICDLGSIREPEIRDSGRSEYVYHPSALQY